VPDQLTRPVATIKIRDLETDLIGIRQDAGDVLAILRGTAVEHVTGDHLKQLYDDVVIIERAVGRALDIVEAAEIAGRAS
jgi:predicted ThiF/HesA family dinucleotide-utilizing enzyme